MSLSVKDDFDDSDEEEQKMPKIEKMSNIEVNQIDDE